MKILEEILSVLLPVLIREAGVLLGEPVPSDHDHAWIVGLVKEVCGLFKDKLPGWLHPSEEELELLVQQAIAKVIHLQK